MLVLHIEIFNAVSKGVKCNLLFFLRNSAFNIAVSLGLRGPLVYLIVLVYPAAKSAF